MRFGLSLPMQHPVGDDLGQRLAEMHWPGMPHQRVLQAIQLLGERVLPHFA